jgi:hypothetical protein
MVASATGRKGPFVTAATGPSASTLHDLDQDLESKVFIMRGNRKLVRHLGFSKAAGERPNSLRISVGSKHGTALTLKNKSFAGQYRRAVEAIAKHHGIPDGHPIRKAMEATSQDYLAYYSLRTQPFKFERQGDLRIIDDVAFPVEAEGAEARMEPPGGQSGPTAPQPMLLNGLVRGVTFRPAAGDHAAHIHVRRWRGKAFSLSLENVSFAVQYEKAVRAMADSLGLANDDPSRTLMLQSGPAFLQHYGLTTAPVTIPDVVVIVQQPE